MQNLLSERSLEKQNPLHSLLPQDSHRPYDNGVESIQKILEWLRTCFSVPLSPQEIAEQLKEDIQNVTVTLGRMVKQGQIEKRQIYW